MTDGLEATASQDATLRVWRGDASGGDLRDYTVPVADCSSGLIQAT